MTLEQFLEKLEQTPRDWAVLDRGQIRREPTFPTVTQCPITSLCDMSTSFWHEAANRLELSIELERDILRAADNDDTCVAELRSKLLKACGL